MDINIIGVPLKYGCDRDGVEKGPDKLRELNMVDKLKTEGNSVYDMGNVYVPNISKEDKFKDHKSLKYLNPIITANNNLAHMVYSSLRLDGFPLIVGGDHALAIGSIAGASKFFKKMAVIWIDAHGDINDMKSSPSGNIHGMPLAISMGIGEASLVNLYSNNKKVSPEDVYIIGARDLDPGEIKIAVENNVNLYTMEEVREKGIDLVLDKIIGNIKTSGVDGVHLSFDIDSIDKSLVPGTGTPVEGGFNIDETKKMLETILKQGFITSMDFVELNPKLDKDGKTANICIDLIETISKFL